MAPDVVERRAKGLETYMATIIHRFPDMLECSHLDRYDLHDVVNAGVENLLPGVFTFSKLL